MGRLHWIVLLCLARLGGVASAETYHVAQTSQSSDWNEGTAAAPWRTISHAAGQVKPGDTVLIHRGVYREWVAPSVSGTPEAPITFAGVPKEEVVLSGADLLTSWTPVPGEQPVYCFQPWSHRFIVDHTADGTPIYHHPGDKRHELIGRAEQVIVDGELLQQVLRRGELRKGTFCADLEGQALYVWLPKGDSPNEHRMEAASRELVFGMNAWTDQGRADYIRLRDLTFRYGANFAQRGVLWVGGDGWQIENVVVEWTNGCGVVVGGRNLKVKNLICRHNGQIGLGGSPQGGVMEDVKLLDNNRKGFDTNWEAGGMKFALAKDMVLRRFEVAGNRGPGIWFDIDNRRCSVSQSFVHDNQGPGIFVEISGRGGFSVTDNVCVANGLAEDSEWGAAGILLGESCECVVERNLCVGNREGIALRMQEPRSCPSAEPRADGSRPEIQYTTSRHKITHNVLAFNRDWQLAFWGDNPFFDNESGGKGTDPERIGLDIDYNVYYGVRRQGLVLYGPTWLPRHKTYANLLQWQRFHGFDPHSVFADPQITSPARGDFRLRSTSPAYGLKAVPEEMPVGIGPSPSGESGPRHQSPIWPQARSGMMNSSRNVSSR